MPVRIRLARRGSKKRPYYSIVVAHSEAPRDGRFIERVGTYNPLTQPETVTFNTERVQYWLAQGVEPTRTVMSLIRKHAGLGVSKAS